MTDRARDAVARMRRTLNDCATFDRQAVGNDFLADITQKSRVHDYTAACIDAGRELPAVLSAADRYRLAWMSARRRAAVYLGHFAEMVDRVTDLESDAALIECNARRARLFRRVAELSDDLGDARRERDEARAEVVRLGKQSEARRLYVAMVADRHLDPAPYLFSDLDAALTFVKAEALKLVESERYIEEVTGDGFLYMANCGNEGDYVWVVEREIDGGAPDA